jgi:D-alanyl-D-alanine carboxypeptidase/D-alanyl-D-alanine-endopeptidase (penicillin-binding protein 4)
VRRLLVPAILALVAIGSGAAAVRSAADPAPAAPAVTPVPVTPVLSARRVPAFLAAPVADQRLTDALNGVLARSPQRTCLLVDAGGRPVFAHNPDVPVTPASTEKLATATAALTTLDPATRLRTTVGATKLDGKTVAGDLWVVGGGDPVIETADYAGQYFDQPHIHTSMEALADRIAAKVRVIEGSVRGDDSRYDRQRYVEAWPSRYVADAVGPLSALSVNDGLTVYPRSPDEQPGFTEQVTDDPTRWFATVLTNLLRARGVDVKGEPGAGTAPGKLEEVATADSPPVRDLVTEMLRESDNNTAELLVKEMGVKTTGKGTTAAGTGAVRAALDRLRLPAGGVTILDGSGLGLGDKLTCGLVLELLRQPTTGPAIETALPVAGRTGTLRKRFTQPPVEGRMRAKTGTLNQVTALSGFVDSLQGQRLTFSYIANLDPPALVGKATLAIQDDLAAALIRYPDAPPLADLGPEPLPTSAHGD